MFFCVHEMKKSGNHCIQREDVSEINQLITQQPAGDAKRVARLQV